MVTKNKHGRVGVKRQRPTRGELKKNMYGHGFTAGRAATEARLDLAHEVLKDERDFMKGLLKLKSAGAIHAAIGEHLR